MLAVVAGSRKGRAAMVDARLIPLVLLIGAAVGWVLSDIYADWRDFNDFDDWDE